MKQLIAVQPTFSLAAAGFCLDSLIRSHLLTTCFSAQSELISSLVTNLSSQLITAIPAPEPDFAASQLWGLARLLSRCVLDESARQLLGHYVSLLVGVIHKQPDRLTLENG